MFKYFFKNTHFSSAFLLSLIFILSACASKLPTEPCRNPNQNSKEYKPTKTAEPKTFIQFLNNLCEAIETKEDNKNKAKRTIKKKRLNKTKSVSSTPVKKTIIEPEEFYNPPPATGRITHPEDYIFDNKKAPVSNGVITQKPKDTEAPSLLREYDPKSPIRVVGPTYLHIPSTEADQPIQDRTNAQ